MVEKKKIRHATEKYPPVSERQMQRKPKWEYCGVGCCEGSVSAEIAKDVIE